jgi:peroxiredoxin
MAISEGDRIPDVKVAVPDDDGNPQPAQTGDLLSKGKVVLFGLPGAFTPGCSRAHLPGYVVKADELKAKGVDTIACTSVNDAFVMHAWAADQNVNGTIVMIGDGNGEFAKAMGREFDGSAIGLGTRSQRYAAVIEDGVVQKLFVEPAPGVTVSSAEHVLDNL